MSKQSNLSNQITTFQFNKSNVRNIISKDNEPLFCLSDVCKILELTTPAKTAEQIKEEFGGELNSYPVLDTNNHKQDTTFITEPQLYFVLFRSRSDIAKPFRQWVFNDVLPAIRKTGSYGVLSSENQLNVRDMISAAVERTKLPHQTIYNSLYHHFKISTYKDLKEDQLEEVKKYLDDLTDVQNAQNQKAKKLQEVADKLDELYNFICEHRTDVREVYSDFSLLIAKAEKKKEFLYRII